MTTLRTAAQQALEALMGDPDAMVQIGALEWEYVSDRAITALRAALAEPVQEQYPLHDQQLRDDAERWKNIRGYVEEMEREIKTLRAALAEPVQEPVACLIGTKGSAFDSPTTKRAYTYAEQPGNVVASRLGFACNAAASQSAGDSIDRGLGLLQELQRQGFGVFDLGAEYAAPPQRPAEPQEPDSPARRCGGPGCDMRCCQPVQEPQGCDHCNHPLYAAIKCRVCGRVTEPVQEPKPVEFDHGIGADRFKVVRGAFWWHVLIGDSPTEHGKFRSRASAEKMAADLLREFRNGAFVQYEAALAEPTPLEDVVTHGSAWSKDGKRIDPMSVYAEPVQEPVLQALAEADRIMGHDDEATEWRERWKHLFGVAGSATSPWRESAAQGCSPGGTGMPAAPPQRKPLTEEEIQAAWDSVDMRHPRGNETRIAFARAIERAHKIGGEG